MARFFYCDFNNFIYAICNILIVKQKLQILQENKKRIEETSKNMVNSDSVTAMQTCKNALASFWTCINDYSSKDLEAIVTKVEQEYEAINAYTHVIGLSYTSFISNYFKSKTELQENSINEINEKLSGIDDKSDAQDINIQEIHDKLNNLDLTSTLQEHSISVINGNIRLLKLDNQTRLSMMQKTNQEIIDQIHTISEKTNTLEKTITEKTTILEEQNTENSEMITTLNLNINKIKNQVDRIDNKIETFLDNIEEIQHESSRPGYVTIDGINNINDKLTLLNILRGITQKIQLDFTEIIETRCTEMEERIGQLEDFQNFSVATEVGRTTMFQRFEEKIQTTVLETSISIYTRDKQLIETTIKDLNVDLEPPLSLKDVSQQLIETIVMKKYNNPKYTLKITRNNFKYTL